MLGSALQSLARVVDIAKTDMDARAGRVRLSTSYRLGAVTAQYISPYTSACVWTLRDESVPHELEFEVDATLFRKITDLFPANKEVTVKVQKRGLVFSCGGSQSLLGTQPLEEMYTLPELTEYALIDSRSFINELGLAFKFTAESIAKAVLTGVRVALVGGKVRFIAFNGFSTVFASELLGEPKELSAHFVIPARDGEPALGVLSGTTLSIQTEPGSNMLVLHGDSCWVRMALYLDDEWPTQGLAQITRAHERIPVDIPAQAFSTALKAMSAFSAENNICVAGKGDGTVTVRTAAAEAGQYITRVPGDLNGEFWYSADSLKLASQIADELKLEISANQGLATLVRGSGNRKVWIAPRYGVSRDNMLAAEESDELESVGVGV